MARGNSLTHVDENGKARMVDVSGKARVRRTARAEGFIRMAPATAEAIRNNTVAKGDVLAVARIAGIMAAKRASDLIPLCHNIEIEHIDVDAKLVCHNASESNKAQSTDCGVKLASVCVCTDKTGIEMEALTAVSVAALTVYDMCKAIDKSMVIENIHLVEKTKEAIGE